MLRTPRSYRVRPSLRFHPTLPHLLLLSICIFSATLVIIFAIADDTFEFNLSDKRHRQLAASEPQGAFTAPLVIKWTRDQGALILRDNTRGLVELKAAIRRSMLSFWLATILSNGTHRGRPSMRYKAMWRDSDQAWFILVDPWNEDIRRAFIGTDGILNGIDANGNQNVPFYGNVEQRAVSFVEYKDRYHPADAGELEQAHSRSRGQQLCLWNVEQNVFAGFLFSD